MALPATASTPAPHRHKPAAHRGIVKRLRSAVPGGQFVRYLCVGGFNTLFGYTSFVVFLTLLNDALPQRFLYLTVVLASVLAFPLNVTVAYFGYKFFVFRTKGNYLREWLKCFAVYGTSNIPGLVALSGLTRYLQTEIHKHAAWLHVQLRGLEGHLSGGAAAFVGHVVTGRAMAGYIAGAIVIGVSTLYSFVAHKRVTFRTKGAEEATH